MKSTKYKFLRFSLRSKPFWIMFEGFNFHWFYASFKINIKDAKNSCDQHNIRLFINLYMQLLLYMQTCLYIINELISFLCELIERLQCSFFLWGKIASKNNVQYLYLIFNKCSMHFFVWHWHLLWYWGSNGKTWNSSRWYNSSVAMRGSYQRSFQ